MAPAILTHEITPLSKSLGVRHAHIYRGGATIVDRTGYSPCAVLALDAAEMDALVKWWAEHRPPEEDAPPSAIDLLSQLFFLLNEHPCDFRNGVTYQEMDEGEVKATVLLDRVRRFLAERGDEYAQEVELWPTH